MRAITPLMIDFGLWVVLLLYWFASASFTHKTRQRETWPRQLQHAVPFYLALFLIFTKRSFGLLDYRLYENNSIAWLGTFITCAGVAFAFWARITIGRNWDGYVALKHGHRLIRTGPYAMVRHPIYTGFIVAFFGSAISSARIDAFVGLVIVTVSFVLKLRQEETLLAGEFGEGYADFIRTVPALLPLRWMRHRANRVDSV